METNTNLQELYEIDEVYEFKIINIFPANYCKIIDERTGVDTYLRNISKLNLRKNQIIKCRVFAFDSKRPFVELVDAQAYQKEENKISEESLLSLLDHERIKWNVKDFIRLLLSNTDDKTFENQAHKWIQQQLNKKHDLSIIQDDCANLLENSNFLNLCNGQERDFYQDRMTQILELIEYYNAASELVENDKANSDSDLCNEFINILYSKLSTSGYIYHPQRNFNILTCLFLLRPDIMNSRIRELLDIVNNREYETWNREPFKNAMFKVFELFISYNEDKIDKIKNNDTLVDNLLLALHLQLFLMGGDKSANDIDLRMIQSRICVMSAYKDGAFQTGLINAAFYNLFNSEIPDYNLSKNQYQFTPYKICNYPLSQIDSRLRYTNKNVRIDVAGGGVTLYSDVNTSGLRPVFPKELELWNNLQIYRSNRFGTKITSTDVKDLNQYQELWNDIEIEFLSLKQPSTSVSYARPKRYRTNDVVLISFVRQDERDKDKFYCRIEEEYGGEGFIYLRDIVTYSTTVNLRDFYDPNDGSRYVFRARIKEIVDDTYHFSMLEEIKEIVNQDFYSDDEEIYCSIGNNPRQINNLWSSVAVTEHGVGITLEIDPDFDDVQKYDVVTCRVVGKGIGYFNLNCRMTGFAPEDFDIKSAFRYLMNAIYESKITDSNADVDVDNENISPLEEKYLRETIFLIDRMACVENDYVKSFNYLGFARMLCLLLNWDAQAAYYKGRMDIISNLHYFGINSTIDDAKLKRLADANAELLSGNSILKERFLQLQTVSYKDKPQYNSELFQTIEHDPNLKELASLVLAYNIAKQSKLDNAANEIYNKITHMLNIKGFETGLKSYGDENDVKEFKTSIVYPAGNGITTPNFDVQIKEILRVINAFLNSNGGALYIGVNNAGMGVGIDEDLKTPYYYGDRDKYLRSIQDVIAITWNNSILTTYIDIRFDDDNKDKDIVKITVLPHEKGIAYEDMYWVKANGSKRRLTKKEYDDYKLHKRIPM